MENTQCYRVNPISIGLLGALRSLSGGLRYWLSGWIYWLHTAAMMGIYSHLQWFIITTCLSPPKNTNLLGINFLSKTKYKILCAPQLTKIKSKTLSVFSFTHCPSVLSTVHKWTTGLSLYFAFHKHPVFKPEQHGRKITGTLVNNSAPEATQISGEWNHPNIWWVMSSSKTLTLVHADK